MTDHRRGVSRPPARELELTAFREAHRDAYLRYAQARIDDQAQARACVDAVFDALAAHWLAVLGSACPAARVWAGLRGATEHRMWRERVRAGEYHTVLRGDQADIMLLRHRLRMPVDQAASLMGLTGHDGRALLRGAERDFGRTLGH
ncbi:hypothetical protein [Streptomyces sp. NPDC057702]|uniref:hypothetical protein n=1 Tax=unclassified Streptomyces TaxID=2593676 RepID=UPI00369A0DFC